MTISARARLTFMQALMAGLVIGSALAQGSPHAAPPAQKMLFHIDSVPVAEALKMLGEKSGLTVVMYSDLGRGILASPVLGVFAPREALDRLLAHTGLRYEYLDAKTVLILGAEDFR